MPVGEALAADNAVLRTLAILDRRVGKRRLPDMLDREDHPLGLHLLRMRCATEGITTTIVPFRRP